MKRIVMVGMLAGLMMASGCASYMAVSGRNAELDKKAVQLRATPDGAYAAVDLLGLKGYWQAWKAEPATMTGATILDGLTAAGAVWAIQQATQSDGDSKPSTPAVQNNGGTVIINTGSGDTTYTTTTTGAAP